MIVSKQNSNMFDSKAQTFTIPVNTEGVMGAGLALYAKLKYPTLLHAYKEACRRGIFKQEIPEGWHEIMMAVKVRRADMVKAHRASRDK